MVAVFKTLHTIDFFFLQNIKDLTYIINYYKRENNRENE